MDGTQEEVRQTPSWKGVLLAYCQRCCCQAVSLPDIRLTYSSDSCR